VFNAGKEIEAMKNSALHLIASSLLVPSFGEYLFTKVVTLITNPLISRSTKKLLRIGIVLAKP
jgi:hypothetical protein